MGQLKEVAYTAAIAIGAVALALRVGMLRETVLGLKAGAGATGSRPLSI